MTFSLHSDPAHGYLYVTAYDLQRAGVTAVDFTTFSFLGRNGSMYLEEDCDMSRFAERWEGRVGKFEIDLLRFDGPAPCRDLPRNTGGLWEPFGAIKGEVKAA